jgi:hypothetical protein
MGTPAQHSLQRQADKHGGESALPEVGDAIVDLRIRRVGAQIDDQRTATRAQTY